MTRRKTWAFENSAEDVAPVPPLDTQGSLSADFTAPENGNLFEDNRVISTEEKEQLDMPDSPHEDVVTDATSLHSDESSLKEKAAARSDEQREEKPYTPPKKPEPKPEDDDESTPADSDDEEESLSEEDADKSTDSEEPDEDAIDNDEDNSTFDEDSSDEDYDNDSEIEDDDELDSEEESDEDDESDSDEESDEDVEDDESDSDEESDEDYGDAETAEVGEDKVESTESDVEKAVELQENIDEAKDQLEDDKEELEKLKNVVTESLSESGLSKTAFDISAKRLNAIASRWSTYLPTVSTESNDRYSQYQNTTSLLAAFNVAIEDLEMKDVSFFEAKIEAMALYINSIREFAAAGVIDANRKADKLNTLLADWHSKPIVRSGNMFNLLEVADPYEAGMAATRISGINLDEVVKLTSDNIAAVPCLCGCKGEVKPLVCSDGELMHPDQEYVNLGANSCLVRYTDPKLGLTFTTYGLPEDTKEGTFAARSRREVMDLVTSYKVINEAILNLPEAGIHEIVELYRSIYVDDIANENDITRFRQLMFSISVIRTYSLALVNISRAVKDALNEYLKNPDYSSVGTEGFFDNVIRLFNKQTKVDDTKEYITDIRDALNETVLDPKWWDTVESIDTTITDPNVIKSLVMSGYSKSGVADGDDILKYYTDLIDFDKKAEDAGELAVENALNVNKQSVAKYIECFKRDDLAGMKKAIDDGEAKIDSFGNPLLRSNFKVFPISSQLAIKVTAQGLEEVATNSNPKYVKSFTKDQIIALAKLISSAGNEYGWSHITGVYYTIKNGEWAYDIDDELEDAIKEKYPNEAIADVDLIDKRIGGDKVLPFSSQRLEDTEFKVAKAIVNVINSSIRNK